MKTAISIPDPLFEAAEALASQLSISRSELFSKAVASYISAHQGRDVTEKLDALYTEEKATLDRSLLKAQLASVADEGW